LTNRVYGRDKYKWGIIAEGQNATISNLKLSQPE